MAFGIMVNTPEGFRGTSGIRAVRKESLETLGGTSGTISLPVGWTADNGIYFLRVSDNKVPPVISISSTNFSWSGRGGISSQWSSSFTVLFMRYK